MDPRQFLPGERRRHLGAGAGAHAPCAEHGLVRGVLVEVDEHPGAALFLPPLVGDQVGPRRGERPGDGHGGLPGAERVPARLDADVDVQPAVAGRLDERRDPVVVEESAHLGGRLLDHRERDAGGRVEVDAQLVGVVRVAGPVGPRMESETAEVGGPQHVGDVGHHDRPRGGAVRRRHDRRLQPVRGAVGNPLLEEVRAGSRRSGSVAAASAGRARCA